MTVPSRRVLCIGIATIDVVNAVDDYPPEDAEVRARAHTVRMGGNAANTAIMLAQLGAVTSWAGNLPASEGVIESTFRKHGVNFGPARRVAGAAAPLSSIVVSRATGTRTIVHYRDMPEYSAADFVQLDLGQYDWLHFEGRAVEELDVMLTHARKHAGLGLSLEIEKPRVGIEELASGVDLVMYSRHYALARGFGTARSLLDSLPVGLLATCTWGELGAWAIDAEGRISNAVPRETGPIVDTVGAGDSFNAAMILGRLSRNPVANCLRGAVDLASRQCTVEGLTLPGE